MKLFLSFLFSVLISIPIHSSPLSAQSSQFGKQSKMKQPLKRSELKLIENIKKTCIALSINPSNLAEAASELEIPKQEVSFARVVKEKIHDLGVPYGEYYVNSYEDNPEKVTVDFLFKDNIFRESSMSIEVLEEGFGEYTISPPQGGLSSASFSYSPPGSISRPYWIEAFYNTYTDKIISIYIDSSRL
jgi:hypothetical protein